MPELPEEKDGKMNTLTILLLANILHSSSLTNGMQQVITSATPIQASKQAIQWPLLYQHPAALEDSYPKKKQAHTPHMAAADATSNGHNSSLAAHRDSYLANTSRSVTTTMATTAHGYLCHSHPGYQV
jgi:hypothetical protein